MAPAAKAGRPQRDTALARAASHELIEVGHAR
jgi:hypothetical protein